MQYDGQRVNTFEGCKYSALKDHCIEIKKIKLWYLISAWCRIILIYFTYNLLESGPRKVLAYFK